MHKIQAVHNLTVFHPSAPVKEEKSEVQSVLEQWQEEIKSIQPAEPLHNFADDSHDTRRNHYDEDLPPPPTCFSLDESENVDSADSVVIAAANALRGVELRSRETTLQPDDQASVYDKAKDVTIRPYFRLLNSLFSGYLHATHEIDAVAKRKGDGRAGFTYLVGRDSREQIDTGIHRPCSRCRASCIKSNAAGSEHKVQCYLGARGKNE
jgi:hypothetical protein